MSDVGEKKPLCLLCKLFHLKEGRWTIGPLWKHQFRKETQILFENGLRQLKLSANEFVSRTVVKENAAD